MTDVTVSERDREAAKRFVYDYNVRDIFHAREAPIEDLAEAIAQARAEERAECAKHVIESRSCKVGHSFQPSQCEECYWFDSIAAAIRARGEKP